MNREGDDNEEGDVNEDVNNNDDAEMEEANEDDDDEAPENNNDDRSLLEQLMERIRNFLGDAPEANIDPEQARRLLEAGAGDLDVVTSLFLDHYYASIARARHNDMNNARRREENEEDSPRRVRRRLEEELEEQAMQNNEEANDEPAEANNNNDNEPPAADMPPPALPANRRRAAARRAAVQADDDGDAHNGEGAAVSDDEDPLRRLVSRRARRRRSRRQDGGGGNDGAPLLRNISIEAGSELEQLDEVMRAPIQDNQVSVKREEDNDDEDEEQDDCLDDFLSDHDWILQSESSTSTTSFVMPPVLLLWGDPSNPPADESPSEANNGGDHVPPAAEGRNVVAAEDGEDGNNEPPPEPPKEGIPKTWVRAGFTRSSCATGLVTQPPDDKGNALHRLRQSQNRGSRNIAPPPYHCRGVTALFSIVTALIYSGVSIQGSTVDCSAVRTPFAELSEEERKREFDTRLVDALSSLLLVAAKASLERKKRALAKRRLISPPGSGDDDKLREQTIQRKLRLVPTCRFSDDNGTGDASLTEGRLVKISTSYTSIQDIRSYVISTVRSFAKKGGCALFLETIIRIHGQACVDRMLRLSRRKAGLPEQDVLIKCECEKRQKKLSQMPFEASSQPAEEPSPLDHTCMSTELISLLLTGEVHSDFHGWSTGGLGIGLLSNEPGEVGRQLMRPQKPVWLLRGDTCYTVAWLSGNKDHAASVSRGERPGTLHHWNGWFGHRHKSTMRLIAARGRWSPPVFSKVRAADSERKTITETLAARRREQSHLVSSDEQGEDDPTMAAQNISKEEIDRVKAHPDDEKLFPDEFRQWRFDLGHPPPEKVKEEDDVKIGPVSTCGKDHVHWTPYFRLDERQKRIVDMKMSPKIKLILWTRWPGATIDRFTPEDDETPPVV